MTTRAEQEYGADARVRAEQAYNDGFLAHFETTETGEDGPPACWDALTDAQQDAYVKFVQRVRYLDREKIGA